MGHVNYKDIGQEIAEEGWGIKTEKTIDDLIKGLTDHQEVKSLLAFIASKLNPKPDLKTVVEFNNDFECSIQEHVFAHRELKHGECPEFIKCYIISAIKRDNIYHYTNARNGRYYKTDGTWHGLTRDGIPFNIYIDPMFQPIILNSYVRRYYNKWMRKSLKRKKDV